MRRSRTYGDELAAVGRSYRVFQRNFREFEDYLARYDDDITARIELWKLGNQAIFEAFLDEIDRLLHNCLAAVATLREHTRRLRQQYPPSDPALTAEYETRTKETLAEIASCAVRTEASRRRDASQTPRSPWRVQLERRRGPKCRRSVFRKPSCWRGTGGTQPPGPSSRCDDSIDLRLVVRGYADAVDEFNGWFLQAFVEWHRSEFEELSARKKHFNERLHQTGFVLPEAAG